MLAGAPVAGIPLGGIFFAEAQVAGPAPRDFTISYGSVTVGTEARPLHGRISVEREHATFVLDFQFLVHKSTPALFAQEIQTIEEAFRTPHQNLTVTGGDTETNANWYDLSHTVDTGMQARPRIEKRADNRDTGLSRLYHVRIEVDLPADRLGSSNGRLGRRESTVSIAYSSSRRRTLTVTGVYTAISGAPARTQYEAEITDYVSAVLSEIDSSATWELVEEPVTEVEDTDDAAPGRGKVLRFSRVYRELIYPQAGQTADAPGHPSIVEQQLRVRRVRREPGDRPDVRRLEEAEVQYEAAVDREQTTALRDLWQSTIRGWAIQQARDVLQAGPVALVAESPEYHYDENRITATMSLLASQSPGSPFEGAVTVDDEQDEGRVTVPVWAGNRFARYKYQGPGARRRIISLTASVFGVVQGNPLPGDEPQDPPGGLILSRRTSHALRRLGIQGHTIDVTDLTERREILYFHEIEGAGGGVTIPVGSELGGELGEVEEFGL